MSSPDQNPFSCPTFSIYSRDGLVEIATKVTKDFRSFLEEEEENDDDLFEFALPNKDLVSEVMQKSSTFPLFNREILQDLNEPNKNIETQIPTLSDESEHETPGSNRAWQRKSKSTGWLWFKQFNIRDLLRRSKSDGIKSYMSATKSNKIEYRKSLSHSVRSTRKTEASPHELFYKQKRSIEEGDKRKSYLPYRKDLIGVFSVLGRAF
ncbi:hypothetical protein POM88_000521 [Heracleum sosnowskyi]|uniref:Uncharacterized protein n=1 Tax=Heracleum sosnowskyi TaxID=360622 RepID=A0AAD8JE39_9APIA|nr:hypothetical protein POM88_000521 [Heracleum sosnowskyi]